jgi:hypothetical protein
MVSAQLLVQGAMAGGLPQGRIDRRLPWQANLERLLRLGQGPG